MVKKIYKDAVKEYASRYGISTLENGKVKGIQKLTNEIYEYEKQNQPSNGLFPFLKITW